MESFSYDAINQDVCKSASIIKNAFGELKPPIAVVLGSGLSEVASQYPLLTEISYSDLPALPSSNVTGHTGMLKIASLADEHILFFCGRSHYYEGYPSQLLGNYVRIADALGVKTIISTCAVGSLKREIEPGYIVAVNDHINLSGTNPLIGISIAPGQTTFPDLSKAYDTELKNLALKAKNKFNLKLIEGIYAWVSGPTYETPAESKMLSNLGADVVGMSLLPESIVACQLSKRMLALACVTNFVPGLDHEAANHEKVLHQAKQFISPVSRLIEYINTSLIQ